MNVKISVIMAVYKEPIAWLKESIVSILNQTFREFEFIIINDNPEGKTTKSLLTEYVKADKRIILITNKSNLGPSLSRNNGIKIAKADYLAIMDADDISHPLRLEKQYKFLEKNPNIGILGTWAKIFDTENKRKIGQFRNRVNPTYNKLITLFGSPVTHPTVMLRRSVLFENNILYISKYAQAEDYELISRLSDHCDISNIPEYLLYYRKSSLQMSSHRKKEQDLWRNVVQSTALSKRINGVTQNQLTTHSELTSSVDIKTNFEEKLEWIKFLLNSDAFTSEEKKQLKKVILLIFNMYLCNTKSFFSGYFSLLKMQNYMGFYDIRINLSYWKNNTLKVFRSYG